MTTTLHILEWSGVWLTVEWIQNNMLMLNDDETVFELPQSVIVGNNSISPSKTARNLGVIFDTTMSFRKHITGMSLRAIGRIRRYLDRQSTKQLVISRLNDCNSIFYGLPDNLLKQLQCSVYRMPGWS